MVFEKEFISGKEVRERWNIDRQQFFKIIRSASAEIPGNTKWLLRPHSPRNFKEVVFADGWHWRPHREDHGVIKDNYMPPEHESDLEKVTDFLDHYLYLISDVKVIEDRFRLAQRSESEKNEHPETHEPARRSDYLFRKTGDFWQIRFKGVDIGPIRHVDGLSYLAQYLTSPGVNIPDRSFFQGNGDAMSESAAIQNGLHTDHRPQEISTPEAMKQYAAEYHKLQQEYDDAESDLERAEIEKEMNQILPHLKNRNFTNPDDKKCQANISRRIKTALGKLPADFAQYLKDTITTDNYGRIYRGAERWE
jgi:hypothetical protein